MSAPCCAACGPLVDALRRENEELRQQAAAWRLIAEAAGGTFTNVAALVDETVDAVAERLQPLKDVAEREAERIRAARTATPAIPLRRPAQAVSR